MVLIHFFQSAFYYTAAEFQLWTPAKQTNYKPTTPIGFCIELITLCQPMQDDESVSIKKFFFYCVDNNSMGNFYTIWRKDEQREKRAAWFMDKMNIFHCACIAPSARFHSRRSIDSASYQSLWLRLDCLFFLWDLQGGLISQLSNWNFFLNLPLCSLSLSVSVFLFLFFLSLYSSIFNENGLLQLFCRLSV